MPHRAVLSNEEPRIDDPAEAIDLAVLDKVLPAFNAWLWRHAALLTASNGGAASNGRKVSTGCSCCAMAIYRMPSITLAADSKAAARFEIGRFTGIDLARRGLVESDRALEFGLNTDLGTPDVDGQRNEISQTVGEVRNETEMVEASQRLRPSCKGPEKSSLAAAPERALTD